MGTWSAIPVWSWWRVALGMSYTWFDGRLGMPRAPRLGILGTAPHVRPTIGLVHIGLTQSWPPTASSVLSFRHLSHWDFGPDLTPFHSHSPCALHLRESFSGGQIRTRRDKCCTRIEMLWLHECAQNMLHAELSRGQAVIE